MGDNIRLQPPEPFDFTKPDNWMKWKRRFEQFRDASGLSSAAETRQVSTLLYTMGENADNVLTSTDISEENRKRYNSVIAKFDAFFKVRRNVIFERAKFNRRNQLPGELVEQYITELYALVETCEYGDLTDDILRDRIVVGIKNAAVSKRLQLDPDLSLEKAKRLVRQDEAVNDQQRLLKGDTSLPEALMVNGVAGKQRNSQRSHNYATAGRTTPRTPRGPFQDRKQICSRCGHNKHVGKEKCPAASATCHKCNKKGHYSAQCFSKTHNNPDKQATAHELSLDTAFLDVMTTNQETTWNMIVTLNTKPVEFKLDTGAAVTAISEEVFKTLPTVQLQKPSKILCGPTKQKLNVMGQLRQH